MKKVLKIILIAVAAILLVLAGTLWYLSTHLERRVVSELISHTERASKGFYRLYIDQLQIGWPNRNIKARGIRLEPDTAVLARLQEHDSLPDSYIKASIEVFSLNGVSIRSIRKQHKLEFDLLSLHTPRVQLFRTKPISRADTLRPHKQPHEWLPSLFKALIVREIEIVSGQWDFRMAGKSDSIAYAIENMNMQIDHLLIDSISSVRHTLFCRNMTMTSDHAWYRATGKAYRFEADQFALSLKDSSIKVDDLVMTPQYGKFEFARKEGTDRLEVKIGRIDVLGLDFSSLIYRRLFKADTLYIADAFLHDFKNKQARIQEKRKPRIYSGLQKAPIAVDIAVLKLKNGNATYEELPQEGNLSGKIRFTAMDAEAKNVTNMIRQARQTYTLHAQAKLMDAGRINAVFKIPVDTLYHRVDAHITLDRMDLAKLNSMTEPLAHVHIRTGYLESLRVEMALDPLVSAVDMVLVYKDLKIDLLKEKDHKLIRRGFLSGIVNMAVLSKDHPKKGREAQNVHATAERNPNRSSFNYLWRTVFAGLKETLR